MSQPKTVRVRIAVAVDSSGDWYAEGFLHQDISTLKERVLDELSGETGAAINWIEANVPLPVPQTIEGTVTP